MHGLKEDVGAKFNLYSRKVTRISVKFDIKDNNSLNNSVRKKIPLK
jgi:hypothetical protein